MKKNLQSENSLFQNRPGGLRVNDTQIQKRLKSSESKKSVTKQTNYSDN
jgi:hypothetical protein